MQFLLELDEVESAAPLLAPFKRELQPLTIEVRLKTPSSIHLGLTERAKFYVCCMCGLLHTDLREGRGGTEWLRTTSPSSCQDESRCELPHPGSSMWSYSQDVAGGLNAPSELLMASS
jgi:hypothetical protein